MFDKLREIKDQITNTANAITFDPARFNDPLAEQIRWTPLKGGGSSFRTHKLFEDGVNKVGFKATIGARVFSLIFILAGLFIPLSIGYGNFQDGTGLMQSEILFMLIFGLSFSGVGGFVFYNYSKPIVFDKVNGLYWKGWKAPERSLVQEPTKNGVQIKDIYALQIVEEYIRSDKKSYYSYELNIVLDNGERLNVIDHGNKHKLRKDAEVLSKFLGKPLWDATGIVR